MLSSDPIHIKRWQRFVQSLAATRFASWFLSRTLHHIDTLVLHITHNQKTLSQLLTGLPVVLLTTTGARTGLPRTKPLAGIPYGEDILLIASSFGSSHHPAWYYNLRANPQATIDIKGFRRIYLAREAEGEEYDHYFQEALLVYPGFSDYRQRAEKRHIPIMILIPQR